MFEIVSISADLYTKDEQNLKKLEPTVGAAARPMIEKLREEAAGLETAKKTENLKSATTLLKDAETQKKELITKLKNKKIGREFRKCFGKK